jgi:cytochrome c553
VQPFAWLLAKHIKEGKEQLNLSELGRLSKKRQAKKLQAMIDEASDRTMPLPSYLLIHRDAKLSEKEIAILAAWVEALQDDVAPN